MSAFPYESARQSIFGSSGNGNERNQFHMAFVQGDLIEKKKQHQTRPKPNAGN